MIDYASVAFALGYLYFLLVWIHDSRRLLFLALALLFGCLCYLTKITTMATVLPALAYYVYKYILPSRSEAARKEANNGKSWDWKLLTLLALVLLLPLTVGLAWVKHTDEVKNQSIHTVWLTSQNLRGWNFGTLGQRLQYSCWRAILRRLVFLLVAPVIIAGIWQARRVEQAERVLFWTALAGVVLPILVFFNLYFVHDYYLIAITPFISIVVGYGLNALYQGMPGAAWLRGIVLFCSLFVAFKARHYLLIAYQINYDENICRVGKAIQEVTPENEYVVIEDFDWDSSLLYYAKRKGFMVKHAPNVAPFSVIEGYTTVVCRKPHPDLLSLWKYHRQVNKVADFSIYHVSNNPLYK